MTVTKIMDDVQRKRDSRRAGDIQQILLEHVNGATTATYDSARQDLVDSELGASWAAPAREAAGVVQTEAAQVLARIRNHERRYLFGNRPGESIPDSACAEMGGQFLLNKDRIEKSRLFEMAKRMPKACHLHVHFNTELPIEHLLKKARDLPGTMFIRCTKTLSRPSNYADCEIVFNVLPSDTPTVDIFSQDPSLDGQIEKSRRWMRWSEFRRKFPFRTNLEDVSHETLSCAEAWATEKIQMSSHPVHDSMSTVNGSWACFNQCTRALKGLVNFESAYRWYIGETIDRMIIENVFHAEWRIMLMDKTIPSDDGRQALDHFDQMSIMRSIIDQKKCQWKERFPFGVKIIYCAPRSISHERMQTELTDCIKLKLEFPDLICGFDLVGAEDRPQSIAYFSPLLLAFQSTCTSLGLEIPFLFHAGESLLDTGGTTSTNNSNLYDALLLGTKRVGHGLSLLKHPLLLQQYKRQGISVELCPISEELLHMCENIKAHRYMEMLEAGLHCTVSADNPSILRSSLSHDFYQVMVGSPAMTLHGWRQLAEWSIEHACLSDTEKAEGHDIFAKDWSEFCTWIVEEYGDYSAGLTEEEYL